MCCCLYCFIFFYICSKLYFLGLATFNFNTVFYVWYSHVLLLTLEILMWFLCVLHYILKNSLKWKHTKYDNKYKHSLCVHTYMPTYNTGSNLTWNFWSIHANKSTSLFYIRHYPYFWVLSSYMHILIMYHEMAV